MAITDLKVYGFTQFFSDGAALYPQFTAARITEQQRELYQAVCENGMTPAEVSGKFIYNAANNSDFPAVGDWVMIEEQKNGNAIIHKILPRKSVLARKAAGTAVNTQIIAANIDLIFICMSLNEDFNLRRLERYLALAWDSGARPVILLTKSDLCENLEEKTAEVFEVSGGTDFLAVSKDDRESLTKIKEFLKEGMTASFVGASGVGKSTVINELLGSEVLDVSEISYDGRGKHTTTHRELFLLPSGGVVIDTPGMRELQLESADLSKSFSDIEAFAAQCKFGDCSHKSEPGCAVQKALRDGTLSGKRFENYLKLQKEISYGGLNSKQIEHAKIKNMFGGIGQMKKTMRGIKMSNKRRGS